MTKHVPLTVLLSIALACGPSDEAAETEAARIAAIVEPTEGAVIAADSVLIVLGISGIELAPAAEEREGTAHHHLYVNRELTPANEPMPSGETGLIHLGRAQTEHMLVNLEPGEHVIIARLGDWQHVPLAGEVTDTVTIVVQ